MSSSLRLRPKPDYIPSLQDYKLAKECCRASTEYFCNELNINQIRLRQPPDTLANPTEILDRKYEEFKSFIPSPTSKNGKIQNSSVHHLFFLHLFPQFMKSKKYEAAIHYAEAMYSKIPNYSLIIYFGYLSSLCKPNADQEEIEFSRDIENSYISKLDIPHFTHLLDELNAMLTQRFKPILTTLIMFDTTDLQRNMYEQVHVIPILQSNCYEFQSSYQICEDLNKKRLSTMKRMPILQTTSEGIQLPESDTSKYDDNDIISLVLEDKWKEAMILSTRHLQKNPNDPMFLVHQILSLYKIGKIHDAIKVCTHAYELYKAGILLYIRATLWLSLGETYYAKSDLLKIVDADFVQNFMEGDEGEYSLHPPVDAIDIEILAKAANMRLKTNKMNN
ncbi:hypothetical protein GPJ56_010896 [Histomonas meleagridis]|uniref:uncharacterized protein n=1 Tax=Histomonas meleagridis TaxID=135588 RepID=UPI00355A2C63|nr:hypothetical protein GPJ56_010896 [Histomonas meleagridis]KAH0803682.1 hypothetical protein GO595_003456 [Histomonas meleagridis]